MPNPRLLEDEDFLADCADAARDDARYYGIHPRLRRLHVPEPEGAKCRACGQRFLLSRLTDDLLCEPCDSAVKKMEEGRLP